MATALSNIFIDNTQSQFILQANVLLTANYGGSSTHGDTLDLSTAGVPSNAIPSWVIFVEQSPAGALPSANIYTYMPGTTQANGVLNVRTALGTEFTEASAYGTPPFSVTGFSLLMIAAFPSFVNG